MDASQGERRWFTGFRLPWPSTSEADVDGFEAFHRQHLSLVRRSIYSLGGAQDLDDIVQEAFVRLWKGLPDFRGEAAPATWIYRVALNTAREHWRGQGRQRQALARFALEPRPQTPSDQARWEQQRQVAQALQDLRWEQREAVTLCYLEGLSLSEAAEIVGAPEGTLKSRLHHARRKLAGILQQSQGGRHGQA